MPETFIIVGAGQAGGQAAATLRERGFAGRIVLLGEEPVVPYQRPPLSKKFLAGELPVERTYLRPASFYQQHGIELKLGIRAEGIDRSARTVDLGSDGKLPYDKLLLATGSRPRQLAVPGANLPGVHCLRTIADVLQIRPHMAVGRQLVVVGGGYIGLEVAAVAAEGGMRVTVLEAADRILSRVTSPAMSEFFTGVHRSHGVEIRCLSAVSGFEGSDRVEAVRCVDQRIPADLVVVGIGIVPNVELAAAAGLACENGILVDERCRSGDPNVFAAGDCTNHPNPVLQRRVRLESVQNAVDQAKAAAANMAGAQDGYAQVPWFWSNQYDLKLQSVGLLDGYDQVVRRGDPATRSFALFYLREGVLTAVDAVNMPREYMACRKLIPQRFRIAPQRLADTSLAMQELT